MTDHSPVRYRREGQIAFIDIDNPPVNALSAAVRQGLAAAMAQLGQDNDAQIAVLSCAGRTFIAGADISEFGKPPVTPFLPDVVALIEASEKPIVAALHGTVLGGGLEVALGAHYRVALPGTRMGLPEVTLGLLPGAGGGGLGAGLLARAGGPRAEPAAERRSPEADLRPGQVALEVDPTRALVLSQVVLSFGIPFALVPLVLLTRRTDVMGPLVNTRLTTAAASLVAAVVIALNLFLLAGLVL